MALITDPDLLTDGQEIQISTSGKTVRLSAADQLSNDGVTVKCVYSKLKELWKTNDTYIMYPFPMSPITDEQFEMVNGWDWFDNTTRYLLRTGGWAKKDPNGISEQEWAGVIGLGSLGASDQVYFQQGPAGQAGSGTTNFQLTGQVNQAISVYQSGAGSYDYRTYLKLFCRTFGKTYATSQLSDIGVSTLTYQAYRFPLANATDIKITNPASAMTAAPYANIDVAFYSAAQARTIGTNSYNFHVVVDGDNQNAEAIYEKVQWLLTSGGNINNGGTGGVQVGSTADTLLHFTGDTLYTEFYSITPTGGTYIDLFQNDDINRLVFVDDTNTERQFPFTAILTINFGDNLISDTTSKYWIYFTNDDAGDNLGRDYGTSSAILINDSGFINTFARARTSSAASITANAAHGLSAGDGVELSGVGGTGYNGDWIVVTTPSTSAFTFTNNFGDEAYASDTTGEIRDNMVEFVGGNTSIQRTFDYDTNFQRGGASSGTDAPITAIGLGLSGAQFVKATGTIQRSTSNAVSLVAPLERNYQNP